MHTMWQPVKFDNLLNSIRKNLNYIVENLNFAIDITFMWHVKMQRLVENLRITHRLNEDHTSKENI